MIKKITLLLLALLAVSGLSFASGPQGVHEPGTGIVSPETKAAAQGTGQGMMQAGNENKTAAQGIHEPGTGLTNPELKEAAKGTGQGLEAKAEEAANKTAAAAEKQPGFETALALLGIIGASFVLLRRRQ